MQCFVDLLGDSALVASVCVAYGCFVVAGCSAGFFVHTRKSAICLVFGADRCAWCPFVPPGADSVSAVAGRVPQSYGGRVFRFFSLVGCLADGLRRAFSVSCFFLLSG